MLLLVESLGFLYSLKVNVEGFLYMHETLSKILNIFLDLTSDSYEKCNNTVGPPAGIEPAALRFRCSDLTTELQSRVSSSNR